MTSQHQTRESDMSRTTNEQCAHVATYYYAMFKRFGGRIDNDGSRKGPPQAMAWFSLYWREAEHAAHPGCIG
jgi:hypothetical protein